MKHHSIFFLVVLNIFAAGCFSQGKTDVSSYSVIGQKPHIRALAVVNDSTVWFAGNRGIWGFTTDGGRTWRVDSIRIDTLAPEFRSLAVLNDSTALLLSLASPAYLLRTTDAGKTWKIVYRDTRKDIFFDSMVFADTKRGDAVGDPIEGCFQLIVTDDGGETWRRQDCAGIPAATEGEACFAASNSNIVFDKNAIWFVTGGKRARIYHSGDNGNSFATAATPITAGESLAGIFSLDIFGTETGLVTGGHYKKSDSTIVSLAKSADGGKTWIPVKTPVPFFGSCVQISDRKTAFVTGHHGTFQIDLVNDRVTELKNTNGAKLACHTLRIAPSGRYLWLAGAYGKIARINIKEKQTHPR